MMDTTQVTEILREGIWVAIKVCGPMLLLSMLVGVLLAIFQAVTQIHEQTIGFILKVVIVVGVLLLAGEMPPEFSKACAAKEVPFTPLSSGTAPEDWPEMVTAYLDHVQEKRVRPRAVKGPSIATDIPPSGRESETARQYC